jgi:uncharacterized spore protein YtfJ
MAEAHGSAEGGDFVQRLAERFGASARASTVFGEPVERDGVTVIPVAKAIWGFGGGSGGDAGRQGSGGGGGIAVRPVGYIEVRGDGAKFRPLRDSRLTTLTAAVAGAAMGALLRRRKRRR